MQVFSVLTIILLFLASGCAVVTPTMQAGCPANVSNTDISSAFVSSLHKHGFSIAVASPDIGLIVSEWATTTTPRQEFAATIITGALLGAYNAEDYRERLKLTFSVNRQNNTVAVRPHKQQRTRMQGWSDISLNKRDMLLIKNVMSTAATTMGGSLKSLKWVYPPGQEPMKQGKKSKEQESIFPDDPHEKGSIIAGVIRISIAGAIIGIAIFFFGTR